MKNKKTVGILYGGRSVEHKISIRSAINVFQHIDRSLFEVVALGIDTKGNWYHTDGIVENISEGAGLQLSLQSSSPTFVDSHGKQLTFDVLFPVLHGTDGEDGSIQGLIKAIDCICVGSGVLGASVSMSKLLTKKLLQADGVPINKWEAFDYQQKDSISYTELKQKLGAVFIIKPANLGSSVGVVKVSKAEELEEGLEEAFKYDNVILIEEFIEGRELECAILGNGIKAKASLPGEIIISKDYEFYTFEAKYVDKNAVQIQVPAAVAPEVAKSIQTHALQAYHSLECDDFARVDVFLSKDNKIYINEINAIPGFTDVSMFPLLWKQHGINYSELLTQLIDLATERTSEQKRLETQFAEDLDQN